MWRGVQTKTFSLHLPLCFTMITSRLALPPRSHLRCMGSFRIAHLVTLSNFKLNPHLHYLVCGAHSLYLLHCAAHRHLITDPAPTADRSCTYPRSLCIYLCHSAMYLSSRYRLIID